MSLEQTDTVDLVVTRADGMVALMLIDAESWGDNTHLLQLQAKLNSYVTFIETGQVLETEGVEADATVGVEAVFKHPPDTAAEAFLLRVGETMGAAAIPFSWRIGP